MEGSVVDLSKYRLETAKEDLETARSNMKAGNLRASINRSYYAIFRALRAVIALEQFDSSKHSGVIAHINQFYVKTGVFDRDFSKMIDSAFRLREKADYQDFFVANETRPRGALRKDHSFVSSLMGPLSWALRVRFGNPKAF